MRRDDFERPQPPPIDRPSDHWVCGHADGGQPCMHGPDASGVCSAMGSCWPIADGEAWKCARPASFGGKCGEGPTEDGQCGRTPQPCSPRRSWHHRRRRWVIASVAVSLATCFLMLGGGWRSRVLRPGGLTQSHAQILESRLASDRCAACHPAANRSLLDWFSSSKTGHQGVTQSQLCIDCHHTTLAKDRALMAHNLTRDELHLVAAGRSRWHSSWRGSLPGPAVDLEDVHCAACHREHHGADANLAQMTSGQCQTCHQDRFQSFAKDHPDWQDWPYGQKGSITFDHVTHYGKHFADPSDATAAPFRQDCRTCHQGTAKGEVARVVDFETSCAACHEKAMQVEASEGVVLLAIPSLPLPPEERIGSWPESARGFYDGRIGPLTRLLISGQTSVNEALSHLSADADLAKTDSSDASQAAAAKEVAFAIAHLMDELARRGSSVIVDRLRQQNIPEATAREIGRWLSPQLVYDARERWFGQAPRNLPAEPVEGFQAQADPPGQQQIPEPAGLIADLPIAQDAPQEDPLLDAPPVDNSLLDDPSASDSLLDDPLVSTESRSESAQPLGETSDAPAPHRDFDAKSMMPFGGWFQDDRRLAIRYHGTEHADPVLRSMIDLAVALAPDHPVRGELLSLGATASCVRCHRVDSETSAVFWTGQRPDATARRFTEFSHQPHLHLAALESCTHCHQVRQLFQQRPAGHLAPTAERSSAGRDQFEPLTRHTCVACHTANAAGDDCTQCHHYHIDPMATVSDPR